MAIFINGTSLEEMNKKIDETGASVRSLSISSKGNAEVLQGSISNNVGIQQGNGKGMDSLNSFSKVEELVTSL
jgi:hypothetical protein